MSTAIDIDVAALVGEMEAPACEHPQHETFPEYHDEGPATRYGQANCRLCGHVGQITPLCAKFIAYVLSNAQLQCRSCHDISRASYIQRILGPVNA